MRRKPMPAETKECPKCHKKMIMMSAGCVLTSYPPQYPMLWWCGCGHTETGPTIRGKTDEELRREEWEKVNAPTPKKEE
jgi:hypothetical protein